MNSQAVSSSQSCQTLADWLSFIEQSHPIDRIELGLERVLHVAERGQLQHLPGIKILLGGTNGKGSSARCLEQLLLAQGYSVGVYTSPHLLKFNERLRINNTDASDESWAAALAKVNELRADTALTYFEFTTLAAFSLLKEANVDVCIIEVGLGGRLDATNIIEPDASILTTIDLDHQDWLGNDRETIGREKAGIFRAGKIAVVGDLTVPQSVLAKANELDVKLHLVNLDYCYQVASAGNSWSYQGKTQQFNALPVPALPVQNMATCLACLEALALLPPLNKIVAVLEALTLAGRMQWLSKSPAVILDVAHNPQSAAYLAAQLAKLSPHYRQVHALVGMLKDKDMRQSLSDFVPLVQHWHLVTLPGPRGASATQLSEQLPAVAVSQCYENMQNAWSALAPTLAADDLVLIFGSFVTVSQFLTLWPQGNV